MPEFVNYDVQVRDMDIGQSGYMVPWGLAYDEHGLLWVNSHYQIHPAPLGTMTVRIWRLGAKAWGVLPTKDIGVNPRIAGSWCDQFISIIVTGDEGMPNDD